jgi:putative aminopeptidase FrvX
MTAKDFVRLAGRLMRHPTAPFCESLVRTEVEEICRENRLSWERDPYGNLLIRLKRGRPRRAMVLVAHLDHPGFEILRALGSNRYLGRFHGGVGEDYFQRDIPLRLLPNWAPARLGRRLSRPREFEILARNSLPKTPGFAVWDLNSFCVKGNRIHGRACDDLVGVAAVLATLIHWRRMAGAVHLIGVLSRAEEVGFQGALTVAASRQLSRNALLISLETSKEMPPVKMGSGVIIRVGDRTAVFDSSATRFLAEVAALRHDRNKKFQYQRALMSGGTCEGTAFQEFGYQTAAVCLALGNYHNCGPGHQIVEEFLDVSDACSMVDLLVAAAGAVPTFPQLTGRLSLRLRQLLREGRRNLKMRKQESKS